MKKIHKTTLQPLIKQSSLMKGVYGKINFVSSTANAKHKEFGAMVFKDGGFNGEFD
ncbi:hypothetical protein P3339_10130 [Microbulbifer sp. MLAF003]|uniref:hypothetical protein n=1 Tax=Microbulbifer sp. MLAF003 TaxID=3032582 RepID=UPI0024ACC2C5|nr:hypothetical protein [Microbulbifer sp. MLAF003]WHI53086.1 hypothetical protein P3339_10130 [Microbulbifer sp. MLAF003]